MPVYAWKGIDRQGTLHEGMLFSSSSEELTRALEKKSLGLLTAHHLELPCLSGPDQHKLFSQLYALVSAHIPLYTALLLLGKLNKGTVLGTRINAVGDSLAEGMAFSQAVVIWRCGDPLAVALVKAGEEAGSLVSAFEHLVTHRIALSIFKKKIRQAVRVPSFTLFFFCISLMAILVLVVPQLEGYMLSCKGNLPSTVQWLCATSAFVRSWKVVGVLGIVVIFSWISALFFRSERGRLIKDWLLIRTPCIRSLLLNISTAQFLRELSLLLERNVPLVQALELCIDEQKAPFMRKELIRVKKAVEEGGSVADAFASTLFSTEELATFCSLGESTGQLAIMITYAANFFQDKAYSSLEWYITCINPLLIVCMGVLIAGLICSVYMPLMTISFSFG